MIIDFDNPKHETLINNYESLCKRYDKKGLCFAEMIIRTVDVLIAANSLFDVPRTYHPHPLHGEYKGCFAIDVTKKYRLIFRPVNNGVHDYRIDNYKTIQAISILELLKDYHK